MTQETKQLNIWYQSARTTAVVGAVFAGLFTVLLVVNLFGSAVLGPSRETRLAAMQHQAQKDPTNETLLSEVRRLDLKIRQDRLWRLDFAERTAFALLGSVIVLLIAGKIAYDLGKEPPRPQHGTTDRGEMQVREGRQARWAVAGGLAVLAVGMTLLGMMGHVRFAQAQDAEPPFASMQDKQGQWPRFRGPGGAGVSAYANIATSWNGKTGEGILWKTAVPMPGRNSPVVWKDRVFLVGADPNARKVYCFDARSGRLQWTGDVPTVPVEEPLELMEDTGYAACTAATDGRRIYAIFPTGDVAAFDFNGRRLWHKNLGMPDSAYGYAASLETYEKLVIIQYDQGDGSEGKSKVIALDGTNGRVAWETKRDLPNSWSSPVVVEVEGKPQLITVADPNVVAYNPADGKEIWRAECLGGDVAPSPIYAGGLILAIEPYAQLVGIKPTGQGDVSKTHVVWKMEEGGPDICSPVSDGTYVYLLESADLLICCRIEDGHKLYEQKIKGDFRASPSIVGDKLYILDMKGVMRIAQVGPEYKELGKCELGEECFASPAFADGRMYIRGVEHLYCIGKAQ
ncbi:MAG TPA: PQQ-binding-like beta-propeller repeat protein [Sedimentisphaerales bacterium]|jgi:outer membrane protein assembly factor BamB|nr:PQQ-binding-like beta-propeller repeat protein [Sedimentisphaerales bacterium]HNU30683.1 PQQ-binding-like beta-propeller repeat protein [Sedimentisphaerales bacterium]